MSWHQQNGYGGKPSGGGKPTPSTGGSYGSAYHGGGGMSSPTSRSGGYTSGKGTAPSSSGTSAPSGRPGGFGAPPSMPPAPASGPPPLTVSGCKNTTVANIIKGEYVPHGTNHGKPVYKKNSSAGSVSVLIYFWDDRDGPSFSGWWFGPKVGGDQVWAYNGNKSAQTPPPNSWQVPWDGPVDDSLRLTIAGGAGQTKRSSQESAGPPMNLPPSKTQRQQEEEDRRRREAERQRAIVEQQRRDEERKRRQREKEEEQARRHAELKKKREEEEQRRKEQAAALAVRKVIQRVRIATPESYDNLRAELEEAQAANLENMGSQAEKVSQEAEKALQQAQQRIDEIEKKREEEERERQEEERRRREEAEKVDKLLKEATEDVAAAEEKVKAAMEIAKPFSDDGEFSPEKIVELAEATEKVIESARTSLDDAHRNLNDKRKEMGETSAAAKVKKEMSDLHGNIANGRRALEKIGNAVDTAKEKAARKSEAMRQETQEKEKFSKYDADDDLKLSRDEVMNYSKAEFDFELPHEVADRIMQQLEPINYNKFYRVRTKVAVAMMEAKARIKRAAEEEKKRVIAERRAQIQSVVDDASEKIGLAEKGIGDAENTARPFSRAGELTVEELKTAVAEVETCLKTINENLEQAANKLKEIEEACAAEEALKDYDKRDVPRLQGRHARVQTRVEKVFASAKSTEELAVRKAYAEIEQQRSEVVTAMRAFMNSEAKTGKELFNHIKGVENTSIAFENFEAFLKNLPNLEVTDSDEKMKKLFSHIAGDESEITGERFAELIRLFYKCIKATVVTDDITIKSKTVRRLDVGEVLEAIEGPTREEGAGVQRVKCQAVNDAAVGWVTIAGNQGTAFLEPGGNLYSCVRETPLTDALSVSDSKTVRRIAKGEVIEVLEFFKRDEAVGVTRVKGKAKQDGATGWITLSGNQGTAYLEPC